MTTLILARHGHSTYNGKGLYTGQADPPLDKAGQEQALQMAALLAHQQIDAIYASDLCRAVETARPVATQRGFTLHTDAALREIDMGAFTGLPYAEVGERFPTEYAAFRTNIHAPAKGGESIAAACARIQNVLQRILEAHDGERVLVCSHALTCRLVHCLSQGRTLAHVMDSPVPPNATPVFYSFTEGQFSPL